MLAFQVIRWAPAGLVMLCEQAVALQFSVTRRLSSTASKPVWLAAKLSTKTLSLVASSPCACSCVRRLALTFLAASTTAASVGRSVAQLPIRSASGLPALASSMASVVSGVMLTAPAAWAYDTHSLPAASVTDSTKGAPSAMLMVKLPSAAVVPVADAPLALTALTLAPAMAAPVAAMPLSCTVAAGATLGGASPPPPHATSAAARASAEPASVKHDAMRRTLGCRAGVM